MRPDFQYSTLNAGDSDEGPDFAEFSDDEGSHRVVESFEKSAPIKFMQINAPSKASKNPLA
jgi:hypothetical protein